MGGGYFGGIFYGQYTVDSYEAVEPSTLQLNISTFIPVVTIVGPTIVTPTTKALVVTSFAPTAGWRLIPAVKNLILTSHVPNVQTVGYLVPIKKALVITKFAPTVIRPNLVVPTTLALHLSGFEPQLFIAPRTNAALWVIIYNSSGQSIGSIPYITATKIVEGTNQIGMAMFVAPTRAAGVSTATIGKEIGIWRAREGEIFRGYITQRKRAIASDGTRIIEFEVAARAIELQRLSTWRGIVLDDVAFSTAVSQVLSGTGWSAQTSGFVWTNITKRFDNMSRLDCINELAGIGNAYWRTLGTSRIIQLVQYPTATGMVMANVDQATTLSSIGLIESLENVSQDMAALANVIVAEGKTDGDALITLQRSNRTYPAYPYAIQSLLKLSPSVTNMVDEDVFSDGEAHEIEIEATGQNRALIVLCITNDLLEDPRTSTWRVNGKRLNRIFGMTTAWNERVYVGIFLNPEIGHNTVSLEFYPGDIDGEESQIYVIALQDVDQSNGNDFLTGENEYDGDDTTAISVIISNLGDTMFDFIFSQSGSGSLTANSPQEELVDVALGWTRLGISTKIATSGATDMGWTKSVSSPFWYGLFSVKPQLIYYIADATSIATYGEHDFYLPLGTFIRLTTNSDVNIANAMYDFSVDYLLKHKDPALLYDFNVAFLPLGPTQWVLGDSIRTIYQDADEQIDAALICVERVHEYDDTGTRYWRLTMSDKVQFRQDDEGIWLLDQLKSRVAAIQINQT